MAIRRLTPTVKILWKQFEDNEAALSVVELVKQLDKSMNKTTVYRILDRLEKEGRIHSFIAKDGLKWYAKCHECSSENHLDVHPHFQCNECGKVECLQEDIQIPQLPNYSVQQAQVLLLGQCENCLNQA